MPAAKKRGGGYGEVAFPTDVKKAVVKAVPAQKRKPLPSSLRYRDTMQKIRAEVGVGKPVALAYFVSKTGAYEARRAILRGERMIDGKLADWDLQARKVEGQGVKGGEKYGSVLFATLIRKGVAKK